MLEEHEISFEIIKNHNIKLFNELHNAKFLTSNSLDVFSCNLLEVVVNNINDYSKNCLLLSCLNKLINYSWEWMHIDVTNWEVVLSSLYPTLYSSSILLFVTLKFELFIKTVEEKYLKSILEKYIQLCDYGILMGPPDNNQLILSLNTLINHLNHHINNIIDIEKSNKILRVSDNVDNSVIFSNQSKMGIILDPLLDNYKKTIISYVDSPSLMDFYDNYMKLNTPVVITNAVNDWPCFLNPNKNWSDLNYIKRVCGNRTVPVELGRSYLSSDSKQTLMTINSFIDNYCTANKRAYLAQHRLFDQIPILKNDIIIPDYCSLYLPNELENDEVLMNAWFGPTNTISPLHYDSYHNLLTQIVGYKYIRLYDEKYSNKLAPCSGIQSNSSQIDLTNIEEIKTKYIDILDIPFQEIVLCPGQMLFIPRWCWHYVQSISIDQAMLWFQNNNMNYKTQSHNNCAISFSFSVNFWWGDRLLKSS